MLLSCIQDDKAVKKDAVDQIHKVAMYLSCTKYVPLSKILDMCMHTYVLQPQSWVNLQWTKLK